MEKWEWEVQAVAGPIPRSVQDLEAFLGQVVPRAKIWERIVCAWKLEKLRPEGSWE